jgi:hypothetical protein
MHEFDDSFHPASRYESEHAGAILRKFWMFGGFTLSGTHSDLWIINLMSINGHL